jgi:hypothetical protein
MSWTDSEVKTMADAHYKGHSVWCPCPQNVPVEVRELSASGSRPLNLSCPSCGLKAGYTPMAATAPWTLAETQEIKDGYSSRGYAHCPSDGSLLNFSKPAVALGGRVGVEASCKRCGRRTLTPSP